MTAGYSGTSLARKLSLKDAIRVWWDGVPESLRAKIANDGIEFQLLDAPQAPISAAHVFTERADRQSARAASPAPRSAQG